MENTKLRASQKYKKRSTFDSIWRQLRKTKGAIVGMILLVVIIIIALVSPYIFNYETDVIANNVKERMQHPSSEHWFGTDDLGRDIFARVCYGARYSLAVGLVAVAVALVVGVTLGAAAGYVGGVFENLIMRVCDIFSSIPSVLMAIAVVSALGKSTFNLMLAVGIASTAPFIRVARAAVLTAARNTSNRPAPAALRSGRSSRSISCRTAYRRSSCRRRCVSARRSSPRRS